MEAGRCSMIQIISMRSPVRSVEGMTGFMKEVQRILKDEGNELYAMSVTALDMYGYITYLIKVDKNEEDIGKRISRQLQPCRWSIIDAPLEGFVWKSVNEEDIPIIL